MKIAIYGTSRSGKDYLISHVLSHFNEVGISAIHLPGSSTLNGLAMEGYGRNFKQLRESEKHLLREEFTCIVDQADTKHDVVFVDGHYSFPDKDGFNVVFTDSDKYCYDHFFYLDTLTELILDNSRNSSCEKKNLEIQPHDIDQWKAYEIKAMQNVCECLNKELVILDEDTETCVEFVASWVENYSEMYDYSKITNRYVKDLINQNNKPNTSNVLIIDCDNTYAINDTTYDFCDYLDLDKCNLKSIFSGDRYSSYQFFKTNKLYSNYEHNERVSAASHAKSKIMLSSELDSLIKESQNSIVIALTAGLIEIWQPKAEEGNMIDSIFGNSASAGQQFLVTPLFKKYFAKAFIDHEYCVTSIGDSIIDIPMLETSDYGFIVAHSKLNKAVMEYFNEKGDSKISQIFGTDWCYPVEQLAGVN